MINFNSLIEQKKWRTETKIKSINNQNTKNSVLNVSKEGKLSSIQTSKNELFPQYNLQIVFLSSLVLFWAKIEANDNSQRTPLHFACWNDHLPVVQYLIDKGANIEAKNI